MNSQICDLCGGGHSAKRCTTLEGKEVLNDGDSKQNILCYQTLPSWVRIQENPWRIQAVQEIRAAVKIGPFLAPYSSTLNKNIGFPLYVQISDDVSLWIDQTDGSKCNWLSLIPTSSLNNNLVACQIETSIYYVAMKHIKVGQELKVWYAPFYQQKLPPDIQSLLCKKFGYDAAKGERAMERASRDFSSGNENKESESYLGSSSSFLISEHNADSSNPPVVNVALKNEPGVIHPLNLNSVPSTKEFYTSSIPLNSSIVTVLSSSGPTLPPNAANQPLILVPTSHTPLNSFNFEVPVISSVAFPSLSVGNNEVLPFSNSVVVNLQQLPDYDNSSQFRNSCLTDNIPTDLLKELNIQLNPVENIDALNDPKTTTATITDSPSCSQNSTNSNNDYPFSNLESTDKFNDISLSAKHHFNLPTLQNITISQRKIIFTHQFSDNQIKPVDAMLRKSTKDHDPNNSTKKQVPSHKVISVVTKESSKGIEKDAYRVPDNASVIQISEENPEVLNANDFVSLSISKDSSEGPLSKVLSVKKLNQTLVNKESEAHQYSACEVTDGSPLSARQWFCVYCSNCFSETLDFALHLKDHVLVYLGRRFVCPVCSLKFKNQNHYEIHLLSHPKNKNTSEKKDANPDQSEASAHSSISRFKRDRNSVDVFHGNFSCQICFKRFSNARYLFRHLSKHSGEFVCGLCRKEFTRKENLKKHLCSQRNKQTFQCPVCSKLFSNVRSYKSHSTLHDENTKCLHCLRIFLDDKYLKNHQNSCAKITKKDSGSDKVKVFTENLKYACHICDRNFSSMVFLRNHVTLCKQLEAVNLKGIVNCDVCDFPCAGATELKTHLQTHTHPYLCSNCSQRFRARGSLEMHICGLEFLCDFCNYISRSMTELYKHITSHGPPPWSCERCRYPIYKKERFKLHECHIEVRPGFESQSKTQVQCPICPSVFATEHNLKKHMASIHDVPIKQKFVCNKCSKAFHRSDMLKSHEKVHLAPFYECQHCHRKFKSHRSLTKHITLHTNHFPFTCKYCNQRFDLKKDLFRHERTHKKLPPTRYGVKRHRTAASPSRSARCLTTSSHSVSLLTKNKSKFGI